MKFKSLHAAAAAVSIALFVSACAPPAEQESKEAIQAQEDQAAQLAKAQEDLAKAQAEADAKQKELDEAKARAARADRAARREREQARAETAAPPPAPVCNNCGVVTSINEVRAKGQGTGMGAVAGAVLGGVIGHQFGGGKGKDVATGVGAVAGGVAGHQVERSARATTYYSIGVRMDDGTTQTVKVDSPAGLSVGSQVRVDGNNISMR